jgi:antitoxin PrlF
MSIIRYAGTVSTSGNSNAIRLEKALFRAHPEFAKGNTVTATVIGPGQMLVSVSSEGGPEPGDDPIVSAFLAFLAKDIQQTPETVQPLSHASIAQAAALTEGIDVDDHEIFLADDFSV